VDAARLIRNMILNDVEFNREAIAEAVRATRATIAAVSPRWLRWHSNFDRNMPSPSTFSPPHKWK
jgi:hypothetical protein